MNLLRSLFHRIKEVGGIDWENEPLISAQQLTPGGRPPIVVETQPRINPDVIHRLEKKYQCPVWVTKQGELVPLAIMSQRHMRNCILYVRRKQQALMRDKLSALTFFDPDTIAADTIWQSLDDPDIEEDAMDELEAVLTDWWIKRGFGPLP